MSELTAALKKIRHAQAQAEPWDYLEPPSEDYQRGYHDACLWYQRLLVAAEHGLFCASCGMPAHRGAGKDKPDKLVTR